MPPFAALRGRMERPQMPETVAPRLMSRSVVVAAATAILAIAGTVLLWAHYGATVFFETIRAGLVACFG